VTAPHIVGGPERSYVWRSDPSSTAGNPMPETATASTLRPSRALMVVAVAIAAMLAGTMALWAHYGTAVFYEMIAAGIASCF
jgi:hypothetical protein